LRAFESAARTLSFQAAAAELGLTPSAVSHQIRALEAYLEVKLFDRLVRSIALTAAGNALQPGLEEGFRRIEDAVRDVRSLSSHAVIVVSVGPSIASKWLASHLYEFEETYPDIEVRVSATNRAVDFRKEDVDIAIRHGRGVYDGLESRRLFDEVYTPVCAPGGVHDPQKPLRTADDLQHWRLLNDVSAQLPGPAPGWPEWLRAEGVDISGWRPPRDFRQTDHAVQAAIDGVGVLMGRMAIAGADVAAGRLVQPFKRAYYSDFGYFLVARPGRMREGPIKKLVDWLVSEAKLVQERLDRVIQAQS
jgi:LysR family glycine cleavage system transcriptional activator